MICHGYGLIAIFHRLGKKVLEPDSTIKETIFRMEVEVSEKIG